MKKSSIPHRRVVFIGKKYKCRSLSTYTVREMFAIEIPVSVVNVKEYSKNRKDTSNAGKFDRFRIFLEVERFMRANLTSKLYDAEYLSRWLMIVAREWYTDDSRNNIILLFERFDQQAHLTRYQVDKAEALSLHLTSDFHVFAFRLLFLNVCFSLLSFFLFLLPSKTRPFIVRACSSSLLTRTQSREDYETNELQVARKSSRIVKFGPAKSDGWTDYEIPSMPSNTVFKYFYSALSSLIVRETMKECEFQLIRELLILQSSLSRLQIITNVRKYSFLNCHETSKQITPKYLWISIRFRGRKCFCHPFVALADKKILLRVCI